MSPFEPIPIGEVEPPLFPVGVYLETEDSEPITDESDGDLRTEQNL